MPKPTPDDRALVFVIAERDAALARLAEAEALLRRVPRCDSPPCDICSFLAAGDSDA